MRIRTDGDYAYREDAIKRASDFYDCNKTKAVVSACEDVPKLVAAARRVLERDDLTHEQRQEIAETLSTRVTSFEVEQTVTVDRD
ncbi:DUF7692 domain-containing protein [Natronobacterium gregoryi]|uniref:DUF7692 domain-containing protein n=2 Tax=Natronobacterium gregoryi TaxID=44930 RepID=L0ADA7_NATGS|nr:hypothetical protein [Natronobacterium gregoryi]AFZ71419.1 hypothetical protein Natgr_0155 [Natronobacterium gregoryi SP2]ELY66944.1 hypothetical protein C490_11928 [Natronobacterium gregoryi SP2]PLK21201.1 hypothetical protein CYV19_05120 [Natronobacterium gregoryi SP2]SFI84252.1 hypothetical protein SAMN05443661_10714 [Natronobacterium gregoryi]